MKSKDFLQVLDFRAKQDGISGKNKASNARKNRRNTQILIWGRLPSIFLRIAPSVACRSFLCRNFAKKMSTCSKEATANMERIVIKWRLSHDNLHLNKRVLIQFNQPYNIIMAAVAQMSSPPPYRPYWWRTTVQHCISCHDALPPDSRSSLSNPSIPFCQ